VAQNGKPHSINACAGVIVQDGEQIIENGTVLYDWSGLGSLK
jgi:hypothetical protein